MTARIGTTLGGIVVAICAVIVPLAGATAGDSLAVVEGWSVVRGSYLFYKGKCTLMKDLESSGSLQLQVHPDPDNRGSVAALLVGLDVIRAGLKMKYNDPKADITRVTSALDGGDEEPMQMVPELKWSAVYLHRGNDLLTAQEMVVLIDFALSNKSTGQFKERFPLDGLAKAASWFQKETCA